MQVIKIEDEWCLTVDGEVLAVFTSRSAARKFLLWKGQKYEKTK